MFNKTDTTCRFLRETQTGCARTYRIRGNCWWYIIIIFSAKQTQEVLIASRVWYHVPGCRCRFCNHTFMCHKYHVEHISKQWKLDHLKTGSKRGTNETPTCAMPVNASQTGFWFLVFYTATQLVHSLQQIRIQVVRSNKVARKRLTKSNGTPTMDLGHMNVVLK